MCVCVCVCVCSKLEANPACLEGLGYLENSLHTAFKAHLNGLFLLSSGDTSPPGEVCPVGALELPLFTVDLENF